MKILISSHAFAPSFGGIETVSRLLAQEFCERGHELRVITDTPDETAEAFPFPVIRRAGLLQLIKLIRWCDIFWHNNLSVRTIWPALLLRKPVVITHQGSYAIAPRGFDPHLRLKHAIANRTTSVAISEPVARAFASKSTVIGNPYDARIFTRRAAAGERRDLAFVGRLVQEKGLDILLEALARLRTDGISPSLTIIGGGPLLEPTQERVGELGLQKQVTFAGAPKPAQIAELLNQHRILVVPSRYAEPFGVVALEGIACGCAVIGSSGGGLPEAIGRCGLTFTNGDAGALADAIAKLLRDPPRCDELVANGPAHLARFHPATVAESYLEVFDREVQR